MYDYLIVGAGLFGAVFAYEANKRGKKCLVIDRRNHIAGNVYTEKIRGINVHKYGAHIFHTSDREIWDFMNQFAEFNNFICSPIARYKDEIYNLPFNMNTFSRMWRIATPAEAQEIINKQIKESGIVEPSNLREQAIQLVGKDIYEKLIKGYTEKQWGRSCDALPPFIIKRLPVRFTYDNRYFHDRYQGIPVGGYTDIIKKMLAGSDIELNVDYIKERHKYADAAKKIIYTGMIDEYFDYRFGSLQYRSLYFETECRECENYQGNAVINYTDGGVPYTRIIEHKHFEFGSQPVTVITREYPREWQQGDEAYYPINDDRNHELYERYKKLALTEDRVIFGGRLGEYAYYDMDKVIRAALECVRSEMEEVSYAKRVEI